MFKNILIFLKKQIRLGIILLALNLLVLGLITYTSYNMIITLKHIEKYIDIQVYVQNKNIRDLYKFLYDLTENNIIINNIFSELILQIKSKTEKLEETQTNIDNKLKTIQTIDLENKENIKKANLIIYNKSEHIMGAGTHIKIQKKDYILTCAHLIVNPDDLLIAIENETQEEILLKLIKYNEEEDLALFKLEKIVNHIPFLEISQEFPQEGSEIIVIGNPDRFEDVITDGIISKIGTKQYLMTNKVYSGNSGGAVLYKGKIVGVISSMQIMFNYPQIENFAIATNLKTIQNFLKECNLS